MAFYFYLSTKIIMVFITKSYQDLFGVRSYINAFIYDKSERENITDKELQAVLKDNGII